MIVPEVSELLLIQKFIFLLDDFHYQEYKSHLVNLNASLSLKLVESIRNKLPEFDSADTLCKKIYGSAQKSQKLNFNQLGSYSFRLSYLLALNYPGYLLPNFAKLQKLVNEGNPESAAFLAQVLLDVAERIDDFQSQVMALKFLSQRAFLLRANNEALKMQERLETAIEAESLLTRLECALGRDKHMTQSPFELKELDRMKAYYGAYANHPSAAIRIFSQYAYISCVYLHAPKIFESPDDSARVIALQKEIKTHCYVVFPFMIDIKGSVDFLALNSIIHLSVFEDWKPFEELSAHYDDVKFWKSFMNAGRLNLLSAAASRFLTRYHCYVCRTNYNQWTDPDDMKYLDNAIAQCEELLQHHFSDAEFEHGARSVQMIYGVLLILHGGDTIRKGVDELESMLITYQQLNLSTSVGSIFFGLMIGYTALKDYPQCFKTFARFERAAKGKTIFEGNKLKIYAYYYLSKWLFTGSKQYERKMTALLKPFEKDEMLPRTIIELVHYFKMPVGVHYDPAGLRQPA